MSPLWKKLTLLDSRNDTQKILLVFWWDIPSNFHDLIFAFFTITFTSQNIQYTEIISGQVFFAIRNFLNCSKWLMQMKKVTHFPPFFTNFVTHENDRIYGTSDHKSTMIWPQVIHREGEKKEENGSGHCQYIFSFPFKIDNLKVYLVLVY